MIRVTALRFPEPLIEAEGRQILLPNESFYRPHPEALAWHREQRGAFLNEINYMGTSEFSTRLA
jgi:hypothetical protein